MIPYSSDIRHFVFRRILPAGWLLFALILGAQQDNPLDRRVDRLVVVTTLGQERCPYGLLSCDTYAEIPNLQYRFEITDRPTLARITRQFDQLQESDEGPMWVSMYLQGYRGKDLKFTLCTSHSFSSGYVIGEARYRAIPELDSLIATSLLKKLKTDKISCLSPSGECDTDPAIQSLQKRDRILLNAYLSRRRYR